MSRISIGDEWWSTDNRMGRKPDPKQWDDPFAERVYALQSTVYAHSLLTLWTGTRDNYVALFDIDEYFVVRSGQIMPHSCMSSPQRPSVCLHCRSLPPA